MSTEQALVSDSPVAAAVEAEFEAIELDLRWRQTKSHRFIEMLDEDGATHPVVWKRLDADLHLIQLEKEARRAAAIARARWIEAQRTP